MPCRSASATSGAPPLGCCGICGSGSTRRRDPAHRTARPCHTASDSAYNAAMLRPVLTELALFLTPFALYALFIFATKRGGLLDRANWPLPRMFWLLIAAFLLVIASFLVL